MLLNELIERFANRFGEAFEDFDAKDMLNELQEFRLAILINLTQQFFRDVRML